MLSSVKKVAVALAFFSLFTACSQDKRSLEKFYGADVNYFSGLKLLKEGDLSAAEKYFLRASKKGSYWAARRSAQQLRSMGDVQQRIKKSVAFLKKYDDDDAKLLVCREFMADKEY